MRRGRTIVLPLACALGFACSDDTTSNPVPVREAGAPDASVDAGPIWDGARPGYDAAPPAPAARVPVVAELVSKRVDAQGMLFAAGEMQIGGEPFAQFFAGRNLGFYDRTYLPPDQYLVPLADGGAQPVTDLFGFSTAVESYEYSKYHMNSIVHFSGAGVSLANGPIVARRAEATPLARLQGRVGELLVTAGTDVGGYAVVPAPASNPLNRLGFAGLKPAFAPYRAFDPTVAGTLLMVQSCTRGGGYGGIPTLGHSTPQYECEYNELAVPDAQLDHTLVPAALGFATWKEALWSIDFGGRLHDSASNPVNAVAPQDEPMVGTRQNQVVGTDPPSASVGTFIGSTPLEGMWGLVMLDMMDNLDEWLLSSLTTADGATLGGFASRGDAVAYDYTSPLRWFPAAITVGVDATQPFPPVTATSIADPTSRSVDLAALLLGNAMFFAETDARNAGVGQRIGLRLLFDGKHAFPGDDGLADGEATAHDRALGVMRVAFVDLARVHADPTLGVVMDSATINGGAITRGGTVSTTSLAHVLIGLRQTVLSLNAAITQYGAADESPSGDAGGILNPLAVHPPGAPPPATFSGHVRDVFVKNATFLRDVLTRADGHVANGATVTGGAATPSADPASLESQAAAARGLTEAFLLTGDESFRERARAVVHRMLDAFYSAPARMFRALDGGPDQVHMTPERFAWLQSSLREAHKVMFVPGDATLDRTVLEERIARVNKLYMNGWDDLDGDGRVDTPQECLGARLQSAEQSLTGELGRDDEGKPAADRDGDCVLELGHAKTLSVFAGEVYFHSP